MKILKVTVLLTVIFFTANLSGLSAVSSETEECLGCHESITPGIVSDWKLSRHSRVTPQEALQKSELESRISAENIPENLKNITVGCAECHTLSPETHRDTFEHAGYKVHTIVTPEDCAVCHPVEREQYRENIMSYAYVNLNDNPLYQAFAGSINGIQEYSDMSVTYHAPTEATGVQSCYHCHGTNVEVKGFVIRETEFDNMPFPVFSGWPNQGVGRINPDGSQGACTSCHPRHSFLIDIARQPYTCGECHKGPDVPAYKVYMVSKHGNIFSSLSKQWDFSNVPWTVGKDFTAPTCAACHASLLVDEYDELVAERTHAMSDRLDKRIFGLIYAHPYPKSPNTTIIKNKAGLPLPTELTGEPVSEFLIDDQIGAERRARLQKVCLSCHGTTWVLNHFDNLDSTIEETNKMTLTATKILMDAWNMGLAEGLPQGGSVFDEAIEKKWVRQWVFYANSCRFAAAMSGADYGVFANGRWNLSENIQEMYDWLKMMKKE